MSLINVGLDIKRLYEECGNDMTNVRIELSRLMDEEYMKAQGRKPLRPEDWSIREASDVCQEIMLAESVDVSQFPTITAALVEKMVIRNFESFPGVGDELVEEFGSTLELSKIPGADLTSNWRDIEPGMPYHADADIAEKYVTIEGKKRGDILYITEEAILHDQTGLVMREAGRFGLQAAQDREKKIMYNVQDVTVNNVNYFAFRPGGTRVPLYSGTVAVTHPGSNLIDNALQHWTDLDAARTQFTGFNDANGEPIVITPKILLVPVALETVAKRLIQNTLLPAARIGTAVVGDSPMEANPFSGAYKVISSIYLDRVSTRIWYLGDFKRQFLLKSVYPIQVFARSGRLNDMAWERDITAQFKIRYWQEPGAVQWEHVVKARGTYGTCGTSSYCSSWDEAAVP